MKELRQLKIDSDVHDFIECYNHNKEIVGDISVRLDVYGDFVKILCVFPLKGKKLKYFLKLESKQKTGFMSKYIMKVAKDMNVPDAFIKSFHEMKYMSKLYSENKPNVEEVGKLLKTDIGKFLTEYGYGIKYEVYKNELSKMTTNLCSAIFQQFDKARTQMTLEQ